MPCAVVLAFALFSTGFPCGFIHNFVFFSVFRFEVGGVFLFITVNRIWWLAKLTWIFQERSLLCWGCLVQGGFDLLSGLSSSEEGSDVEACGTYSPRGDSTNLPQ